METIKMMDTGHLITYIEGPNLNKSASQQYRQFLGKKFEDFNNFFIQQVTSMSES